MKKKFKHQVWHRGVPSALCETAEEAERKKTEKDDVVERIEVVPRPKDADADEMTVTDAKELFRSYAVKEMTRKHGELWCVMRYSQLEPPELEICQTFREAIGALDEMWLGAKNKMFRSVGDLRVRDREGNTYEMRLVRVSC